MKAQVELKKRIKYRSNKEKKLKEIFSKPKMNDCMIEHGEDINYLWLLKPTFLNRGRGIHIFQSLEQLCSLIDEYT